MASVVELMSKEVQEDGNEQLDLLHVADPSITLSLPKESFLKAAISLKDQVVEATWKEGGGQIVDPTVYTGNQRDPTRRRATNGICYSARRSSTPVLRLHVSPKVSVVLSKPPIDGGAHRIDGLDHQSTAPYCMHVTFLCGRGGVYALGAVVAHYSGDRPQRDLFLDLFVEMAQERALPVGPDEGGFGMSYELLYGRAGFLWAALFINKHLGQEALPMGLLMPVVEATLAGGRVGASDNKDCPLMFRWHGTRYWGAAHGLAGILNVLLHFPLSEEDLEDVKGTLRYMMRNRFPHSGNYPSSEGNPRDKLMQWSHGAAGVSITLCKAAQIFSSDRDFRDAAIEAGEVVWKKGLLGKVGLADGISGNAYAFLSLYRLTGDKLYEERATAFASYLFHNARNLVATGHMYGSDHAYSLFQGLAGTACLCFDMASPENSRFPGFEL